jgi:4-amino-4-deoxy-L-arabinose transferase-like glycosyltransferase
MLVFGTSRISIMFVLAGLTSIWAFIFYRIARPLLGTIAAAMSAFLLVLLPITQQSTSTVMLDMCLAVFILLAMAAYARYLENERTPDAFMFGLWSALALLVKYDALALALLPPLCIVITGRYYLLRRRSFWLPSLIVLLIAGPWYLIMRHLVLYAADSGSGSPTIGAAIVANAKGLILVAGPVVFALAVIGSGVVLTRIGRLQPPITPKVRSLCIVAVAVIMAVFSFHSFIYPLYDRRYLLPAAPPLILLASQSFRYVHAAVSKRRSLAAAAFLIVLAVHLASTFVVPAKNTRSYVTVTEAVLASGLPPNGGVLVSADGIGEGMLTAEFAMRDHRPDHYVVRATKVLANQTLMGDKYQLRYQSPDEMMAVLDSIPIAVVVIQPCVKSKCGEHENILIEAASRYPERWRLSSVIPSETSSPILIYQIVGNDKPVRSLQIDMTNTLGTTVEKQ